jgi:hypothetical protein
MRLRLTGRLQPASPLRITSVCTTRWSSSSCCRGLEARDIEQPMISLHGLDLILPSLRWTL